jgi:hypothetical protein
MTPNCGYWYPGPGGRGGKGGAGGWAGSKPGYLPDIKAGNAVFVSDLKIGSGNGGPGGPGGRNGISGFAASDASVVRCPGYPGKGGDGGDIGGSYEIAITTTLYQGEMAAGNALPGTGGEAGEFTVALPEPGICTPAGPEPTAGADGGFYDDAAEIELEVKRVRESAYEDADAFRNIELWSLHYEYAHAGGDCEACLPWDDEEYFDVCVAPVEEEEGDGDAVEEEPETESVAEVDEPDEEAVDGDELDTAEQAEKDDEKTCGLIFGSPPNTGLFVVLFLLGVMALRKRRSRAVRY